MKKAQFQDNLTFVKTFIVAGIFIMIVLRILNVGINEDIYQNEQANTSLKDTRSAVIGFDDTVFFILIGFAIANILGIGLLDTDIRFFVLGIINITLAVFFAVYGSNVWDYVEQVAFPTEALFFTKIN